jgi:hypothetical protein
MKKKRAALYMKVSSGDVCAQPLCVPASIIRSRFAWELSLVTGGRRGGGHDRWRLFANHAVTVTRDSCTRSTTVVASSRHLAHPREQSMKPIDRRTLLRTRLRRTIT